MMLALALLPAAACGNGSHDWRSTFLDYARPDTVERLHIALKRERARGDTARRLNQMLEAKNAYLLAELGGLAAIVNQVDRDLADLSGARTRVEPLVPASEVEDEANQRALMDQRRQRIQANLDRLQRRLGRTERLWKQAVARDDAQREELRRAGETIEMFRSLAENRALQLAELASRVDSLTSANQQLARDQAITADSLERVASRVRRVYYVVGTRAQLLEAGVVREITVARKTWRGWRHQRQLVLAREPQLARLAYTSTVARIIGGLPDDEDDGVQQQGELHAPDGGQIREVDRYRDTMLALPVIHHGDMRILSSQEPRFTDGAGHDGRIEPMTTALRIRDPDSFWEGGRYLVIVIE